MQTPFIYNFATNTTLHHVGFNSTTVNTEMESSKLHSKNAVPWSNPRGRHGYEVLATSSYDGGWPLIYLVLSVY